MQNKKIMELEINEDLIRRESDKKPMKIIKDPQPIDFFDILKPEKEKISSNIEELEEGQSQMVKFRIKPRKRPKIRKMDRLNHCIKDLVINKEEHMA